MYKIVEFLRTWTLPVSMILGVASYFIYTSIPLLDGTHASALTLLGYIQPALIFSMLLLTFCKVKPQELHLCRWHLAGLLLQIGLFTLGCLWIRSLAEDNHWRTVIEGGMLCMICPTATAAAVVTSKLGGNPATLTTYTILINLCVAIIVPVMVPLIHPSTGHTFVHDFTLIICKVFPLLFCPFVVAMVLRKWTPRLVSILTSIKDLAFYLWAVALALAIAVTTRSIIHTECPTIYLFGIAISSLVACVIQFAFGRHIGIKHDDRISATQSLGQKNTVFAIWMGYTFLNPVTSIAGGFYSIWHNVYNSYQLYKSKS